MIRFRIDPQHTCIGFEKFRYCISSITLKDILCNYLIYIYIGDNSYEKDPPI